MTLLDRATQRRGTRLLRRGAVITRLMLRTRLTRGLLAPLDAAVDGAIGALDRTESKRLLEQGMLIEEDGRPEEAVDALIRAAETGPELRTVVVTLNDRESLHEVAGSPPVVARMRSLAAKKPAAGVQILVGSFLLDQGHLEEGRATVQRGYRLRCQGAAAINDELLDDHGSPGPSFLVLGPHKSGTTSLHAMLSAHPQVVAPPRKELHFWANRRGRSLAHYEAYFPRFQDVSAFVTGEASATNLLLPEAADDVAAHFPHTKTIALRRDPVARSYSHYQMLVRNRFERRSFEEAIEDELNLLGPRPPLRISDLPNPVDHREGLGHPAAYGGSTPLLLGSCILPFVRMWSEALGPERVLILDSEYLASHRSDALVQLLRYLELPPIKLASFRDRNVAEYAPLAPTIEARLREWFAPHEATLDEFLGMHPARIAAS